MKRKILFVGSFKDKCNDGSVGGQMFACKSLLNSALRNKYDWILLDSTSGLKEHNHIVNRSYSALIRFTIFLNILIFKQPEIVLIFTASGTSFWEKGSMALICKFISLPVLLAPRSGHILEPVSKQTVLLRFIALVFNRVDRVVCQGQIWKEIFEKIAIRCRCIVIPNWINFDNIQPLEPDNSAVDIVFMGRVAQAKGIQDLLLAISKLNCTEEIKLHICGSGSYAIQMQQLVRNLNIEKLVTFHGWIYDEQKDAMLKKANIFVIPSYIEGFPNSLLEAMAYGRACIASKVGAIPETILHGVNGLLIDPGNINQLQQSLKELISNEPLRKKLGKKARDTVLAKHSINQAVNTYTALFEEL